MDVITDIVLIGPIGAGKTTVARLLAEKLGRPCIHLDNLCWNYYREIGIDDAENSNGADGMLAWQYPLHAVERVLSEHRGGILDFGAGHSVYREEEALNRVKAALLPYRNVFLLLPCLDRQEALRILQERNRNNSWLQAFLAGEGYNPNEHFLNDRSNYALATYIVTTQNKSPEQTRDEILALAVL